MDDWGQTTEKNDGGIKYEHDEITCKSRLWTVLRLKDENENYITFNLFSLLSILLSFDHTICLIFVILFFHLLRSCSIWRSITHSAS